MTYNLKLSQFMYNKNILFSNYFSFCVTDFTALIFNDNDWYNIGQKWSVNSLMILADSKSRKTGIIKVTVTWGWYLGSQWSYSISNVGKYMTVSSWIVSNASFSGSQIQSMRNWPHALYKYRLEINKKWCVKCLACLPAPWDLNP